LGLGAVVVPEGASLPVDSAHAAPARSPADHFDRSPTPGAVTDRVEKHEPARKDEVRASPFEALPREVQPLPERKVCDKPVDVSRELDPEWSAAARLAQFEAHLGQAARPAASAVRKGLMLLTADGQAARHSRLPIEPAKIETLAQKILEKQTRFGQEEHRAFLNTSERLRALVARDVNAYVQRVLRECYQIQNESLCDYAAKVEHLNKMRAKTRAVLEQARETKNLWHSQAENPDAFLADPPFAWLEVGDDEQSYTPAMTEQDVAQWRAETEAAARAGAASGSSSFVDDYAATRGPSRLTASERDFLEGLAKKKGVGLKFWQGDQTDDKICNNIDRVVTLVAKMNGDDIQTLLRPLLDYLSSGNPDDDEVEQLIGAMSDCQVLACSGLWPSGEFDDPSFWQELQKRLVDPKNPIGGGFVPANAVLNGALTRDERMVAGIVTGGFGGFVDDVQGKLASLGFFDDDSENIDRVETEAKERALLNLAAATGDPNAEPNPNDALGYILRMEAQINPDAAAALSVAGAPAVGTPKQIRSLAAMETFIKHHEDNLNSMGEDAQLANVDLQNALQKQQQTLQMLSNMSKMLFETAMAVVRKLGT